MSEDYEDDDDIRDTRRSGRGGLPRFGSFVTIAAAMLLLFGAASNVGKVSEFNGLFNIDGAQEKRLQGERLQDERLKTIITLGAVPVPVEQLRQNNGSLPLDYDVLPPRRSETGLEGERDNPLRPSVSMLTQQDSPPTTRRSPVRPGYAGNDNYGDPDTPLRMDNQNRTYVVASGDTWVKIAKITLGDASRWRDLVNANPSAKEGLRVGMRLAIP